MSKARPWLNEPEHDEFIHAGLRCRLVRGPLGAWCGYVALPPGHPLHSIEYNEPSPALAQAWSERLLEKDDVERTSVITLMEGMIGQLPDAGLPATPEQAISVHGGVTYSARRKGEPEGLWWFGFDCSHCYDFVPDLHSFMEHDDHGLVYRTIEYARDEVKRLAEQLARVG